MKIGILETGRTPPELIGKHGSYADMLSALLAKVDPSLTFEVVAVMDGAPLPAITACDGWLITGSRHGVYEELPWMLALEAFLREAVAARIPTVGICFGHQILAKALGARVEKADSGWGVGPHTYAVTEQAAWMDGFQDSLTINAMHQDQVLTLPPGARVIASSDFCPYAGLAYDDTAISFQPHPEFDIPFEHALVASRAGAVVPMDRATPALALLEDPATTTDADRVARWIAAFYNQPRG